MTKSWTAAFLMVIAAALIAVSGCNGDDADTDPSPDNGANAVATVALEGIPILVRKAGEAEFERIADLRYIEAGSTIRTVRDWLSLNVAGAVQVQLSPLTELLVIGPENRGGRAMIVLALQVGEVRINAIAFDRPVLLDTPLAAVTGKRCHFTANVATEEGALKLNVEALTQGIVLANDEGSLPLPLMGRGFVDEFDAPRLLPRQPGR